MNFGSIRSRLFGLGMLTVIALLLGVLFLTITTVQILRADNLLSESSYIHRENLGAEKLLDALLAEHKSAMEISQARVWGADAEHRDATALSRIDGIFDGIQGIFLELNRNDAVQENARNTIAYLQTASEELFAILMEDWETLLTKRDRLQENGNAIEIEYRSRFLEADSRLLLLTTGQSDAYRDTSSRGRDWKTRFLELLYSIRMDFLRYLDSLEQPIPDQRARMSMTEAGQDLLGEVENLAETETALGNVLFEDFQNQVRRHVEEITDVMIPSLSSWDINRTQAEIDLLVTRTAMDRKWGEIQLAVESLSLAFLESLSESDRALQESQRLLESRIDRFFRLGISSTIAMSLAITVVLILVTRSIVRPLGRATQIVREIEMRTYEHQEDIDSSDELGQLMIALDTLATKLQATIHDIEDRNTRLQAEIHEREAAERDRDRAMEALASSHEDLERKVAERTKELEKASIMLARSERLAGLERLVAGVAHEINTPLGVATTGISYLVDLLSDVDKEKLDFNLLRESSEIVYRNVDKAAELIRRFRLITADQSQERPRRVTLRSLVDDTIFTLRPRIREYAVEIHNMLDDELKVDTLPGPLSQVLSNLILNSLIHGFTKTKAGTIEIQGLRGEEKVTVLVKDDGKGMNEATRARVFDPFFTTNRANGGTGLGLFIVHNIVVNQLGGALRCRSGEGEGAVFEFEIPVKPPSHTKEEDNYA